MKEGVDRLLHTVNTIDSPDVLHCIMNFRIPEITHLDFQCPLLLCHVQYSTKIDSGKY